MSGAAEVPAMARGTVGGRHRQGRRDAAVAAAGSGSHGWADEVVRRVTSVECLIWRV